MIFFSSNSVFVTYTVCVIIVGFGRGGERVLFLIVSVIIINIFESGAGLN